MDDYNYDYEDEEYSSPESMEEAEQLPGDWDAKITQAGKRVEVVVVVAFSGASGLVT